ncbi:MAG: succinate dehydrogenase assembly factor 2 [Paracoccaceae bacterium]
MVETPENRLRRLHMRSIRRGIKEMDLILANFSEKKLADLSTDDLDIYEDLLSENDHDLYAWVTNQTPAPDRFKGLMVQISEAFEP